MNQSFELLKLILFSNAYYYLSESNFVIFILINLIIKISNHVKLEFNPTNLDPFVLLFNILFILTKVFVLQLNILVTVLNNTYIGKHIMYIYNYFELKYINIISYIKSKITDIIFGKKNVRSNNIQKLNNQLDINNFLDNLEQ